MNPKHKILYIVCVITLFFVQNSMAQEEDALLDDINETSFDIGFYGSLSGPSRPYLTGMQYNFQYARFFSERIHQSLGMRSGFNIIDMDNNTQYYNIPLYVAFRTGISNTPSYHEIHSLESIVFDLLLWMIPKRIEFNLGPSLGWIDAPNGTKQENYRLNRQFAVSIDAQCRITFKIWRFGLVGTLGASYLPTNNFELQKKRYHPHWFCKATGGLSFRF